MRVTLAMIFTWAAMVLMLLATGAMAHSWYDLSCCSDNDCHPIADCSEIKEVDGGYEWQKVFFKRENLKASHDNQCHVCVLNDFAGLCLYMPMTT